LRSGEPGDGQDHPGLDSQRPADREGSGPMCGDRIKHQQDGDVAAEQIPDRPPDCGDQADRDECGDGGQATEGNGQPQQRLQCDRSCRPVVRDIGTGQDRQNDGEENIGGQRVPPGPPGDAGPWVRPCAVHLFDSQALRRLSSTALTATAIAAYRQNTANPVHGASVPASGCRVNTAAPALLGR